MYHEMKAQISVENCFVDRADIRFFHKSLLFFIDQICVRICEKTSSIFLLGLV